MPKRSNKDIEQAVCLVLSNQTMSFPEFIETLHRSLPNMSSNEIMWWLRDRGVRVTVGMNPVTITQQQAKRDQAMPRQRKQEKMGVDDFIMLAIEKLRDPKYRSIHTVYSGFNRAFREYFMEESLDPVQEVERLVSEGKIARRYVKGGAIISKGGAFKSSTTAELALEQMGLK